MIGPPMARTVTLIALVLSLAALAAGCGGSTSGSTTAAKSASHGRYHKGEFCSPKKQSTYRKAGLHCVKSKGRYRLK